MIADLEPKLLAALEQAVPGRRSGCQRNRKDRGTQSESHGAHGRVLRRRSAAALSGFSDAARREWSWEDYLPPMSAEAAAQAGGSSAWQLNPGRRAYTPRSHEFPGKYFRATGGSAARRTFCRRCLRGQRRRRLPVANCWKWVGARARFSGQKGIEKRRPLRPAGAQQHSLGGDGSGDDGGRADRRFRYMRGRRRRNWSP